MINQFTQWFNGMVGGTWMGATDPTKPFLSLVFFFVEAARSPTKKNLKSDLHTSSIKVKGEWKPQTPLDHFFSLTLLCHFSLGM